MTMNETGKRDELLTTFNNLKTRAEQGCAVIARENAKSDTVIRVVTVLLACLALLNLHFIHVMSQEFRTIISDMTAMYELFERSAERMADATSYVTSMEKNIRLVPVFNDQMAAMNTDVESMKSSVGSMADSVAAMDKRFFIIDQDIGNMALRFRSLNANVGGMQYNVNQITGVVP